jgi:hypothetical protein
MHWPIFYAQAMLASRGLGEVHVTALRTERSHAGVPGPKEPQRREDRWKHEEQSLQVLPGVCARGQTSSSAVLLSYARRVDLEQARAERPAAAP